MTEALCSVLFLRGLCLQLQLHCCSDHCWHSVCIWRDRSLPRLVEFRPIMPPRILDPDAKVHGADTIIWHYGKTGQFSVKSAYRVELERVRMQGVSSSCTQSADDEVRQRSEWKEIWRRRVPPKIRTFMWRV
ncbi:UNVERIFIED_CONTAM: hypothetical protein Sindi_0375300 [Sesamum indicum]